MPCHPEFHRALRCASVAAMFVCAVPCQAAPCRVEVVGGRSPEWRRAALALAEANLTDAECAVVLVEIMARGARVEFVTTDGRRADRTLTNPDELSATVEALRVTGPPPREESATSAVSPEPAPAPPSTEPAPATEQASAAPAKSAPVPAPPAPAAAVETVRASSDGDLAVIFGLEVGARGDTTLLSPVLAGTISIAKQRWELGLTLASEVRYTNVRQSEPIPPEHLSQGNALALCLSVGRREPVGGIALRAGGRVSLAALFAETPLPAGPAGPVARDPGGTDGRSAEGRIGAYVGLAVPRRSTVRFRTDLAADVAFTENPGPATVTPRFALTALIGAEIGGT